jgi:hypothetical protein
MRVGRWIPLGSVISPHFLFFLFLSFFYFRCVLVLLKLVSHASCSSTGSNRDHIPQADNPGRIGGFIDVPWAPEYADAD